MRLTECVAGLVCAAAATSPLSAQHDHGPPAQGPPGAERGDSTRPRAFQLSAQGTVVVSRVAPGFAGRTLTEGYLSQPVLAAHGALWDGRLSVVSEINLEGLALPRGELTLGAYGEGYADRRHPHTYVHDVVLTAAGSPRDVRASLSAGRGFAPFGTDDPMSRPFLKFPVNHHLAQVLERGVLIAALARGPVGAEFGVFNGEEPTRPADLPRRDRLGDSWAARATIRPRVGLEAQLSHARVTSPEFPAGGGLDQRKWSASLRYADGAHARRPYVLVEWAKSTEYAGARRAFAFTSVLAEASAVHRGATVAARAERTTRPEEERLRNPFRVARPAHDYSVLGITSWTLATLRVARPVAATGSRTRWLPEFAATPFVEVARAHASETVTPSAFVPRDFYGSDRLWSASAGLQLRAGGAHGRMGRYGAAAEPNGHAH